MMIQQQQQQQQQHHTSASRRNDGLLRSYKRWNVVVARSSFISTSSSLWMTMTFWLLLLVAILSSMPLGYATNAVDMDSSTMNSTTTDSSNSNSSISSSSSINSDTVVTNQSLIKKARSWILFHRILTSTTNSAVMETIQASSLEWMRRGTINLTIYDPKVPNEEPVVLEIVNDENALSQSFIDDVRTLDGMSNMTTWYQLKLIDTTPDDDHTTTATATDTPSVVLLTSVPACAVLRSNFRDEVLLQFQSVRNTNIISLTYIPYISRFAPKKCMDYTPIVVIPTPTTKTTTAGTTTSTSSSSMKENSTNLGIIHHYQFISKISWETAVPGMMVGKPPLIDPMTQLPSTMKIKPPPGYRWFPNIPTNTHNTKRKSNVPPGDDNNEEEGGSIPPPDNTPFGFFKRYYYIFIPLMIMNLINTANPPPPPSTTSSEQQQGPPPTTASGTTTGTPRQRVPVVATSAASNTTVAGNGGQVRNRRGKKD
jgi:hypothetical protein